MRRRRTFRPPGALLGVLSSAARALSNRLVVPRGRFGVAWETLLARGGLSLFREIATMPHATRAEAAEPRPRSLLARGGQVSGRAEAYIYAQAQAYIRGLSLLGK